MTYAVEYTSTRLLETQRVYYPTLAEAIRLVNYLHASKDVTGYRLSREDRTIFKHGVVAS